MLPLAIRRVLPAKVVVPLAQLSNYFKAVCSTTSTVGDFERLDGEISLILCQLETIFPPAFFTIMFIYQSILHKRQKWVDLFSIVGCTLLRGTNLVITSKFLEIIIKYCFINILPCRYMSTLKGYVRNRSNPEGSIEQRYLFDESLTFCSRYLENVDTRFNRPSRYHPDPMEGGARNIFDLVGTVVGKKDVVRLNQKELDEAHQYVLFNVDELQPWRKYVYTPLTPFIPRCMFVLSLNNDFPYL